jgi:hypothetical protein
MENAEVIRQAISTATGSESDPMHGVQPDATPSFEVDPSPMGPDSVDGFSEVMSNTASATQEAQGQAGMAMLEPEPANIMDLSRAANGISDTQTQDLSTNFENVLSRMDSAQSAMDDYNSLPEGTDLPVSVQNLLKNKISNITQSTEVISQKMGMEEPLPGVKADSAASELKQNFNAPLKQFMGYLTGSQDRMSALHQDIGKMNESGDMSPGKMMTVQLKMNKVSREIELFTNLLSKSIESVKTLMQVQL